MSLRLEVKKIMLQRSPRVKAVDFHPLNSWVVFGLYSGTIALHDYSNNTCIRTLQASAFPIRAIRFIPHKNMIVCGSDDFKLRAFNYNTMEKIKTVDAHNDFFRAIVVHPHEPYVITASDDTKVKIWNLEKDFALVRILEEHSHFVLALALNPKDPTKFASGSYDKTIKVWNLTTDGKANFTLTGHKASVNALDFYKGDKPHLASGSDDHSIRIWDYQTRQCLRSIDNSYKLSVTSVHYHPELPILISTSEDSHSIIHHSENYSILNTLDYNLGMGWSCGVSSQNSNVLAFGYDEGSVVIKIGNDEPVVTMFNGKLLFTKNMEVFNANLKAVSYEDRSEDNVDLLGVNEGSIDLSVRRVSTNSITKELGAAEIYPTYVNYSPNGHHFGICNTREFAVIKLASFKNVVMGTGAQLKWQSDSDFVVLENDTLHHYADFEYSSSTKLPVLPERIFEGTLLTVSSKDTTLMYDWSNLSKPIHKLSAHTQFLWWDQKGELLALAEPDQLTVYRFNKKNYSLEELNQINDRVTSGCFLQSTFYYTNKAGKVYFLIHGKEFFFCNAEKNQFIVGGLTQQNRLYLFDRTNSVHSLYVPFETFNQVSNFIAGSSQQKSQPTEIPELFKNRVAKCYHAFGLLREAYKLTSNHEHKFQLALALGYTRDAYKIATSNNMNQKIKLIGDLSLKRGEIELAIDCYERIDDLSSLLMIYSSIQIPEKLLAVGERAERMTKMNIAYMCYFLCNKPSKCIDVLLKSKRFSEAALFARTYLSSRVSECVKLWKDSLTDKTIAEKISDPTEEQEDDGEEQQGQIEQEDAELL